MSARSVVAAVLLAAVGAAAAAGCGQAGDAGVPIFEAATPLPWLDPARCLTPCAHTDEPTLVTVDATARPAGDGAYSLRAEAQPALAALIAGAARASFAVTIGDAHRTYEQQ